jgi:predicted deacylase
VKSKELALAFGLPYVLTVTKPVQPAKGSSSYAAAAALGIPAVLAEAGGVGQLQEEAVQMLIGGVMRVMAHMGMCKQGAGSSELEDGNQTASPTEEGPEVLTRFEWVYAKQAGMFYPRVAAGNLVQKGEEIGTIGSLFGDVLETVIAPVTGRVLFLTINPSVLEEGVLMGVGVAG